MNIGILTISDRSSRGERADASGPALAEGVTAQGWGVVRTQVVPDELEAIQSTRSEEHTSELQSLTNLVCRLLLEKKITYVINFNDCKTHIVLNILAYSFFNL